MVNFKPGRNDPCHCGSGRKYKKCCLPGESPDQIPHATIPSAESIFQGLVNEVVSELGPNASQSAMLNALNSRAEEHVKKYNTRAQLDLGGLSPDQVRRLMGNWNKPGAAVFIRRDLPHAVLADTEFVFNARRLLMWGAEGKGIGATEGGALNMKAVARAIEELRFRPGYVEYNTGPFKRILEEHLPALEMVHVTLGLAGLMDLRGRYFSTTDLGIELLEEANTGELASLLFITFFRQVDFDEFDPFDVWPELQRAIAYSIFRFGAVAGEFRSPADLVNEILLPHVMDRAPHMDIVDLPAMFLAQRLLDPLAQFGLAERSGASTAHERDFLYRKTALFDQFLRFEV